MIYYALGALDLPKNLKNKPKFLVRLNEILAIDTLLIFLFGQNNTVLDSKIVIISLKSAEKRTICQGRFWSFSVGRSKTDLTVGRRKSTSTDLKRSTPNTSFNILLTS